MSAEEMVAKIGQRRVEVFAFTEVITKCHPENKIVTLEVVYKKPKKYKIIEKINSSISSIIVTNGTVTWIYKPQENSVTILNKTSQDFVTSSSIKFIKHMVELKKNIVEYKGIEYIDERKAHKFKLKIKNLPDFSYWLWIDDDTGLLLKTQTYKDDELVMELERKNIKINTDIHDSEFEFEIPREVKLIRKNA